MSTYVRGGFADDRDVRLPESIADRAAAAEEIDRRADVLAGRERERRVEQFQSDQVAASVEYAVERGEHVPHTRATVRDGIGHTPREFIELCSARADHDDMVEAALERREFQAWQEARWADSSADVSAPTAAEAAADEVTASRTAKRAEQDQLLGQARWRAQQDLDLRIRRMRASSR